MADFAICSTPQFVFADPVAQTLTATFFCKMFHASTEVEQLITTPPFAASAIANADKALIDSAVAAFNSQFSLVLPRTSVVLYSLKVGS